MNAIVTWIVSDYRRIYALVGLIIVIAGAIDGVPQ